MNPLVRVAALALAPVLFACNFPLDDTVAAPPSLPLAEGRQFVMPETIIPAGAERMTCWIPDWVPDQDHRVVHFEPLQGTFGHHLVAMISGTPRQANTVFDCTDIESMASLRPLILPDVSGGPAGTQALLPQGFAVRLPRDARIVFQSHHINTSDRDVRVSDVARLRFAPEGSAHTEASYFILSSSRQNLAPRSSGSVTQTCSPPERLQALSWFGHMHFNGRSLSLTRTRDGATDTLYEVKDWQPRFRDFPPVTTYPVASPLGLERDDTFTLTCHYDNPGDERIRFPTEMCVAIAYYYPALPEGVILCD